MPRKGGLEKKHIRILLVRSYEMELQTEPFNEDGFDSRMHCLTRCFTQGKYSLLFFWGGSILTHAHELIHCQSHCILVTRSDHGPTTYGPPLWVPCFLKGIPSTPSCQVPWELLGNSYPQATNWIDVHLAWGKLQPPNVLFGLSDVMKVSFIRSCFCW